MLEFTRVSRWFRVANGYTLRYSSGNRSWRVCAPGGKPLGTVGELAEAERLANQHAEDQVAAEAAIVPAEEAAPWEPPGKIEVRGYSADDIEHAAEEQGIGVGAAMLSLAMGAPYAELSQAPTSTPAPFEPVPGVTCPNPDTGPRSCTHPDCSCEAERAAEGRYLTSRHGSATMVTQADDDTGDVTMKPCECLSPTGETEDGYIVATPCGGEVPNKRDFRPGHDAKLKSTLIKAFRTGGTLIIRDGGMRTEANPVKMAKERNWEKFLTPAPARKSRKGEGKDNTGVDHADDQPDTETPVGASQPARVKVRGTWKDGFIVRREPADGDRPEQVVVSYMNSKKKMVEIAHPADSDKLQLG